MKLSELRVGETGEVVKVSGSGNFRKRIIEMGFIQGKTVVPLLAAPLQDPVKYRIMGYEVSLRRSEAELIEILSEEEALRQRPEHLDLLTDDPEAVMEHIVQEKRHTIQVALVGNPNCGKTSLFNIASGARERVGNYSGITVDAKEGHVDFGGYHIRVFDLPGTYSLSTYTPEEVYVRKHIYYSHPDIILNIVAASNLERNLYLTTQLLDMDIPMVIALNMYDELEKNGDHFDYQSFGDTLGVPVIPTVAAAGLKDGSGVKEMLEAVIRVYEGTDKRARHVHINHGGELQRAIDNATRLIKRAENFKSCVSARFFATKLMERDKNAEEVVKGLSNAGEVLAFRDKECPLVEAETGQDCESAVINAKYAFVSSLLARTLSKGDKDVFRATRRVDKIITHRIWGYPIFLLMMWLMFECTFLLGAYPQDWIDAGVNALMDTLRGTLPSGPLRDLLVDGCIGGVGAVLSFLPNILILYFFIALMEDSGYLSRAAFLMDKIMHGFGLHGKSFVPMLMGFGCGVPAIMATRTLESRNSRMITMLVLPFISCSARLPAYVLFTAAFFPEHASLVTMGLYVTGIAVAILAALIFRKTLFRGEDVPFVMELPPYRIPTLKAAGLHMWEKSVEYLKKMGTVILGASVIVWALTYFPLRQEGESLEQHQENCYMGRLGKTVEPAFKPLGMNWRLGVSILSALPAKEIAVSTLAVLYTGEDTGDEATSTLVAQLRDDPDLGAPTGLAFMVFMLLCFPCMASLAAIKSESGSWKWVGFTATYTTAVAWVAAFAVFHVSALFL